MVPIPSTFPFCFASEISGLKFGEVSIGQQKTLSQIIKEFSASQQLAKQFKPLSKASPLPI